jgi:RNA polymerase sigma-70 factor (family 1)
MKDIQILLGQDNPAGMRRLYEEFSNQLLQFAFTIIPIRQVAEEIVGDVFIKVWLKRKKVAELEHFKMYLYISIRNRAYSHLRRYNKKKHVSLEELTLPCYQLAITPEEIMVSKETLQALQNAVNDLPLQCRLIFKLVKEDGLKYKEVAQLLELSPKTVENQMGIALKRIHAEIAGKIPSFLYK